MPWEKPTTVRLLEFVPLLLIPLLPEVPAVACVRSTLLFDVSTLTEIVPLCPVDETITDLISANTAEVDIALMLIITFPSEIVPLAGTDAEPPEKADKLEFSDMLLPAVHGDVLELMKQLPDVIEALEGTPNALKVILIVAVDGSETATARLLSSSDFISAINSLDVLYLDKDELYKST